MSQKAILPGFIVDVSSNQDHPINWNEVKKAGCIGAILKASQGTSTVVNPFFHEDLAACNKNKIPVMAYHFAEFGNVQDEVTAFSQVAGAHARVLDIETSSDLVWTNHFFDLLKNKYKFDNNQLLLYGSASSVPRRGAKARLWVADYGKNPGFGVCWQYTENGQINGIANHVDLSRWTGGKPLFDTFFEVK